MKQPIDTKTKQARQLFRCTLPAAILMFLIVSGGLMQTQAGMFSLKVRRQIKQADGSFVTAVTTEQWDAAKTAIIPVDMWNVFPDTHREKNLNRMVPRMNQLVKDARSAGAHILWGPSDVVWSNQALYKNMPAVLRMSAAPWHDSPTAVKWYDPESWEADYYNGMQRGTSESAVNNDHAWTAQHPGLEIDQNQDGLSGDGYLVYNWFYQLGIRNVILMGVHTNVCVLGRPYGLRIMNYNKFDKVVVVRDLTECSMGICDTVKLDGVSNRLSLQRNTDMVVRHIERFWGGSIEANDLLVNKTPLPAAFIDDQFDDGSLYYDSLGIQTYDIGGGFYNMSTDNDYTAQPMPEKETARASEATSLITLTGGTAADIGAIISRTMFGFCDRFTDFPQSTGAKGVSVEWVVAGMNSITDNSSAAARTGLCLGVINADGPLGRPAPSGLTTEQLFVNIRHNGIGKGQAEMMFCSLADGSMKAIAGTKRDFSDWDGSVPLTVTVNLSANSFQVIFSKTFADGTGKISGTIPSAFNKVSVLHAFASFQDSRGHAAALDRLTVKPVDFSTAVERMPNGADARSVLSLDNHSEGLIHVDVRLDNAESAATLTCMDVRGRLLRTWSLMGSANHRMSLSASDVTSTPCAGGVYIFRLTDDAKQSNVAREVTVVR